VTLPMLPVGIAFVLIGMIRGAFDVFLVGFAICFVADQIVVEVRRK